MLEKFVMDGTSHLQSIDDDLASPPTSITEHHCRQPSNNRNFLYVNCLSRHELNVPGLKLNSPVVEPEHNAESTEKEKVHAHGIFEYGYLKFGSPVKGQGVETVRTIQSVR